MKRCLAESRNAAPKRYKRLPDLVTVMHGGARFVLCCFLAHGMHPTCKVLGFLRLRCVCRDVLPCVTELLPARLLLVERCAACKEARACARRLRSRLQEIFHFVNGVGAVYPKASAG